MYAIFAYWMIEINMNRFTAPSSWNFRVGLGAFQVQALAAPQKVLDKNNDKL